MTTCPKCKTEMKKKGVVRSGDTRYEEFLCERCNNRQLKCVGVSTMKV